MGALIKFLASSSIAADMLLAPAELLLLSLLNIRNISNLVNGNRKIENREGSAEKHGRRYFYLKNAS